MSQSLEDWLEPASIQQALYTPGELERISGLGADMQRVWRRRGQLPTKGSGHARFTVAEVFEITLRVALSRAGVPPGEPLPELTTAASGAMHHAIFCHGAVEVIGPASDVEDFLHIFREDNGDLGRFLIGNPQASHFLVLNDRREIRVVDEPADIVGADEELNLVFNLVLLGTRLVERGRKPVAVVQFPDQPGERTIRRLTGLLKNR